MRLTKFVKFRQEKFGGVLFETRSEKVFALNPTAAAGLRGVPGGGGGGGNAGRPPERVARRDAVVGRGGRGVIPGRREGGTLAGRRRGAPRGGRCGWVFRAGGPLGARRGGGSGRAALRRVADHE